MQGFPQDLPFYGYQLPASNGRLNLHLDMNNYSYCQAFPSEALNTPYYSQRSTDWATSCINPSAIQLPSPSWGDVPQSPQSPQSPPFPNPSQNSPSSQSDSEHSPSFRFSSLEATTLLPSFPPATQLPLEEKRAKLMTDCAGSPPVVHDAILHILHSTEWEKHEDIPGDLLVPIVEAIHFPNGGRSGSRGGIDRYRCLWGTCGKVIKRRDHMLNHVRCHLGLKPWVCGFTSADADKKCGTRFLRVDDLKRHLRHIHKHDMDEGGNYFPVPHRVKQVRGPRKNRRVEPPYPTRHDASDDEYKPYMYVSRRGRSGLFGRRYGPHGSTVNGTVPSHYRRLRTPRLSCFTSEPGD